MITKALRHFFITMILCAVLIGIIFLGFYLKYALPVDAWYKIAIFFSFIFIWSILFLIMVYTAMKGVHQIRQMTQLRLEYDFLAWLGSMIVLNNRFANIEEVIQFYNSVLEEHGFKEAPDLKQYYNDKGELTVNKELIFDEIKTVIADILKKADEPETEPEA